jgi:hypothetical protein
MERRLARLLPTAYFHVVFTVPDNLLSGLASRNRELFYDALFAAGSATLLELAADPKRLGAQPGVTCVLHTWTRDLRFHPHLHCIVTGGGLTADGERWRSTSRDYLFPVRVLSALFGGKLLALLEQARRAGRLNLDGLEGFEDPKRSDGAWHKLRDKLYRTRWVSYAKPPFGGAQGVYEYLGRYTHRVGISNHRLLAATDEAVTLRTRCDQTATLHPVELLRRFLLHALPPRFVKLRHYGLLAPASVNGRLLVAWQRLERGPPRPVAPLASPPILTWAPSPALRLRLRRVPGRRGHCGTRPQPALAQPDPGRKVRRGDAWGSPGAPRTEAGRRAH